MELIVKTIRSSFNSRATLSLKWRMQQLNSLLRLIDENQVALCEALKKDLNKPSHETITFEFGLVKNAVVHTMNNLEAWMQPQKKAPIIQARFNYSTYIQSQPYGVALIIGAWNYPYQLL